MKKHFPLALVACLACCSSPREDDGLNTQGRMARSMSQIDMNKVSQFDKAFNTAGAGDRGMGGIFGRRAVEGRKFGGQKSVQTGSFKTKDFSMDNTSNSMGRSQSRFGAQKSSFADDAVVARRSRFDQMSAGEGDKGFSQADASVRARGYRPAQQSLMENKRPVLLIDRSAPREKVAYTEDEIKRLLGR